MNLRGFRWQSRHSVLAILFLTFIVSFMDRMVISVAMPYISSDFQLTAVQSGALMSIFYAGYALMQVPGGLLADRFGVRKVATFSMLWWSVFTAATGTAVTFVQMLIARLLFGLGEGVFPACAFKTIAVWFPQKERATATAVMLASNPLGAALAPLVVVAIMSVWSWHAVFFVLLAPGLLAALLFWVRVPDEPSGLDLPADEPEGVATTNEAQGSQAHTAGTTKPSAMTVLKDVNILKLFLALFFFDLTLWGFRTWLPTYLVKARGFSMVEMGVAASLPFFAGFVGSLLGGYVSDKFFTNHRRVPIIASSLIAAVLLAAMYITDAVWVLLTCQTLAGLAMSFFLTSFWGVPMSTIPKEVMGVAGGYINMAGQIAATVSPLIIGFLVGASQGGFGLTFAFLILALIIACVFIGSLSRRQVAE